jgi:hypothetical protein
MHHERRLRPRRDRRTCSCRRTRRGRRWRVVHGARRRDDAHPGLRAGAAGDGGVHTAPHSDAVLPVGREHHGGGAKGGQYGPTSTGDVFGVFGGSVSLTRRSRSDLDFLDSGLHVHCAAVGAFTAPHLWHSQDVTTPAPRCPTTVRTGGPHLSTEVPSYVTQSMLRGPHLEASHSVREDRTTRRTPFDRARTTRHRSRDASRTTQPTLRL